MTLLSDCSPPGAAFSLERCTISPDPPVVGQQCRLVLTGQLTRPVTSDVAINITATVGILPVWDYIGKLGELLDRDFPIPAPVQPIEQPITLMVSRHIPAGVSIGVKIQTTYPDGMPLFCLRGTVTFISSEG
jgi:hypothetical protein